jgi:hypothetical protein
MKKLFTKFILKPFILASMLVLTSFGFGLRPVNAKSREIVGQQQSSNVGQQRLSSKDALDALIENQQFYRDNYKWGKKPISLQIEVAKLASAKGTRIKRNLGNYELLKLLNSNPALKISLISGGFICVELLSMPQEITRKLTWADLLIKKPTRFIIRNRLKILGSLVTIGIIYYSIRERNYLVTSTKQVLELVQNLELTSNAFEVLKQKNKALIGGMETKIFDLTQSNHQLVENTHSTLAALKKAYGSLVTSNSEIAQLESLLYAAQTKFLECQTHLESALSIPESIRMDVLARFNDQQSQLIIRLQRQLTKALKKK